MAGLRSSTALAKRWMRNGSGSAASGGGGSRAFSRGGGGKVRRRWGSLLVICGAAAALLWVGAGFEKERQCDTAGPADSTVVRDSDAPEEKRGRATDFRVVVLTHSRPASLRRLLKSLRRAEYVGDRVDLEIVVDRTAAVGWRRGLFGDGVDRATVAAAREGGWKHGAVVVRVWERHVGIWGQWIEGWRGGGAERGAVLLEDDLDVSNLWYVWVRAAMRAYGGRGDVFGYSLQRATLRANQTGFGRRALRVARDETAFLYPLVGSWGYAPERAAWDGFRAWFREKSCQRGFRPYVDGLVPTKWYVKQERRRTMWTMWHIRYAHETGLKTVYANLRRERTLAANWREPGLHFRDGRKGKASGVTRRVDFELLRGGGAGNGGGDDEEARGVFRLPGDPRVLDWNGTYVRRDGTRTTV